MMANIMNVAIIAFIGLLLPNIIVMHFLCGICFMMIQNYTADYLTARLV